MDRPSPEQPHQEEPPKPPKSLMSRGDFLKKSFRLTGAAVVGLALPRPAEAAPSPEKERVPYPRGEVYGLGRYQDPGSSDKTPGWFLFVVPIGIERRAQIQSLSEDMSQAMIGFVGNVPTNIEDRPEIKRADVIGIWQPDGIQAILQYVHDDGSSEFLKAEDPHQYFPNNVDKTLNQQHVPVKHLDPSQTVIDWDGRSRRFLITERHADGQTHICVLDQGQPTYDSKYRVEVGTLPVGIEPAGPIRYGRLDTV